MIKMFTKNQLMDFGFNETNIRIYSRSIDDVDLGYIFNLEHDLDDFIWPGFYIICGKVNENGHVPIAYVGKAGGGINRRISQHSAGYNRNAGRNMHSRGTHEFAKFINKNGFTDSDSPLVKYAKVWFRRSEVKTLSNIIPFTDSNRDLDIQNYKISCYSIEEEAFICLFNLRGDGRGYGLINASYPRIYPPDNGNAVVDLPADNNAQALNDFFNELNTKLKANSRPEMFALWEKSFNNWDHSDKVKFQQAINGLQAERLLTAEHSPKISSYSSGAFINKPILVYGVLIVKNFSERVLAFTLDGLYFSRYPLGENSEVIKTAEYLELDE
jgi:hypothetical protein